MGESHFMLQSSRLSRFSLQSEKMLRSAFLPANIHHFTDQICDVWSYRGRGETLQTHDADECIDIVSLYVTSSERIRGGRRCRRIYSDF